MANDDSNSIGPGIKTTSLGSRLVSVTPAQLNRPKADPGKVEVRMPTERRTFVVQNGQVKIPRQRANAMVWPEWFDALQAPVKQWLYMAPGVTDPNQAIEVTYDEENDIFHGPTKEDGTHDSYDWSNVYEVATPDEREVAGTLAEMKALQNAISRFNAKSGKKLIQRLVRQERLGLSGPTVREVRLISRTA